MDYTCSICFEDISLNSSLDDNHRLYITSCNHKYHYSCLYKWCFRKNSCPTCRTPNVINDIELIDENTFLPLNLINDFEIQTQINAFLDIMLLYTSLNDSENDYIPLITIMDSSRNIDLLNSNSNSNSNTNSNSNFENSVNIQNSNTRQNRRYYNMLTLNTSRHRNNRLRNFNQTANNNIRNPQTRYIGMRFRF